MTKRTTHIVGRAGRPKEIYPVAPSDFCGHGNAKVSFDLDVVAPSPVTSDRSEHDLYQSQGHLLQQSKKQAGMVGLSPSITAGLIFNSIPNPGVGVPRFGVINIDAEKRKIGLL